MRGVFFEGIAFETPRIDFGKSCAFSRFCFIYLVHLSSQIACVFKSFDAPKGPRRDFICQTRLERPDRMRRYAL